MMRLAPVPALILLIPVAAACSSPLQVVGGSACEIVGDPVALPAEVPESSGVAPGVGRPGEAPGSRLLWTHNDSGWPAELFGVDPAGDLTVQIRVAGAENVDWEDLAVGPCPAENPWGAEGSSCLLIADTGDNREVRDHLVLYRVPEPAPDDTATAPADAFPLLLPHGPRDIEALLLLPDDRVLLVTKGRTDPVEVYRSPAPLGAARAAAADGRIRMERVQTLTSGPVWLPDMVTGAASTPDGRLGVVRTYQTLQFYRIEMDAPEPLIPVEGGLVNLRPAREAQGEAVAFLPGNRLVLTSEAGPFGRRGQMTFLQCRLPGWEW